MRMTKTLIALAGVLALLVSNIVAAPSPTSDLTPKQAAALVAVRSGAPLNSIVISFIVAGNARCGAGFEVTDVRRVAAIHGVHDGSRQTRKLVFYDLFWNETLGWFMWESRQERGGEAVYLWSELKGQIVNR